MTGTGADQNKRRPMQWTAGTNAGFSSHNPWESLGDNYLANNVETELNIQGSVLEHYKKLIRIRTEQASLRRGYLLNVGNTDNNILSYARVYNDEAIIVLSNFGSVLSSPSLSLPISSLPAGIYDLTELYSGLSMGTLTLNSNGGFSSWHSSGNNLGSRETLIIKVSSHDASSISVPSLNNINLILYPNPTSAQVQLKLSRIMANNSLVEVYTSSGNRIYQASFTGDHTTIQTSEWQTGVYFVKVTSGSWTKIERMVIMK